MNKKFYMTMPQPVGAPPGEAPVWESNGTAVSNNGTSIDVPYPSTVNNGDCLCMVVVKWVINTFTEPTDWDTIVEDQYASQTTMALYIISADGDETGNLTVQTGASSAWNHAVMVRFSGVLTSGTLYEAFANSGIATGTTINIPSITTLGDFRLAVSFITIAGIEDPGACSVYIERWSDSLSSGTPDTSFVGETQTVDDEGEVAADSCAISPSRSFVVWTLALKPAA